MVAANLRKGDVVPLGDRVLYSVYGRPIEILLVEDNEDDASLTVEALAEGRVCNNVTVVADGVDALTYLRREGRFATSPRPDLVLLDLRLPRMSGQEVLAEIKDDADLRQIPVVMLSTSNASGDVLDSYRHHANCYVAKPIDLDEFVGAVRKIEDFWISFNAVGRTAVAQHG